MRKLAILLMISVALVLIISTTGCERVEEIISGSTPTLSPECVSVTESIAGANRPAGVFFTNTVTLNVPDHFTSIVMTLDCEGTNPIGIDDEARVTITSPSGQEQVATINENDAFGGSIGEQWVLSSVIDFEPGLNQIKVELVNVYAPPGSNSASSPIYIVVLPP